MDKLLSPLSSLSLFNNSEVLVLVRYDIMNFQSICRHLAIPHILVLCTVLSLFYLPEIDSLRAGASWARGLKKIQDNFLNLADPIRMLSTGSSLTSVYVGGTGSGGDLV